MGGFAGKGSPALVRQQDKYHNAATYSLWPPGRHHTHVNAHCGLHTTFRGILHFT